MHELVNVIDVDRAAEMQPRLARDFPNNAPRLVQRAQGYHATVCNGNYIR